MKTYSKPARSSSQPKPRSRSGPPRARYRELFDPPALSNEGAARRSAERFRSGCAGRYGPDVPEAEAEAHAAGFLLACRYPDAEEGAITGYRAGQRHAQRQRARPTGEIPVYVSRRGGGGALHPGETLPADCLMTPGEAAGRLGIMEAALRALLRSGELSTYEHGGRRWIHPQHLSDYQRRAAGGGGDE